MSKKPPAKVKPSIPPPTQSPENAKEIVAFQKSAEFRHFAGPLPPPELLKEYAEIIPTAPERILVLLENQSAHRQEIEKRVIESDIRFQFYGLWVGAGLTGLMIGGGLIAIYLGHGAVGIGTVGTAAATLVTAFFARVLFKRKTIAEKPHAENKN